jgi:hypothetical protein
LLRILALRIPASFNQISPLARRDSLAREKSLIDQRQEDVRQEHKTEPEAGESLAGLDVSSQLARVQPAGQAEGVDSALIAGSAVVDDVPPQNRSALNTYLNVSVFAAQPDNEVELVGVDIFV